MGSGGHSRPHSAFAQRHQDSSLPSDSEIRKLLADRIDTYQLSVGMVVGIVTGRVGEL